MNGEANLNPAPSGDDPVCCANWVKPPGSVRADRPDVKSLNVGVAAAAIGCARSTPAPPNDKPPCPIGVDVIAGVTLPNKSAAPAPDVNAGVAAVVAAGSAVDCAPILAISPAVPVPVYAPIPLKIP